MPECMYKDKEESKCCCSTSGKHLQVVNDEVCGQCDSQQDKPTISDKLLLQKAIQKAIQALPSSIDNVRGREILFEALKI